MAGGFLWVRTDTEDTMNSVPYLQPLYVGRATYPQVLIEAFSCMRCEFKCRVHSFFSLRTYPVEASSDNRQNFGKVYLVKYIFFLSRPNWIDFIFIIIYGPWKSQRV